MKLYDGGRAPNPRRVTVFLKEKGIEVETVPVDMGSLGHRSDEITAKNPLQRLPVLELDDGTILCESVAICRYFEELHPDPPLFGIDARDRALVEMWNRRAELIFLASVAAAFRHLHPAMAGWEVPQVPAWGEANKPKVLDFLRFLDGELAARAAERHAPAAAGSPVAGEQAPHVLEMARADDGELDGAHHHRDRRGEDADDEGPEDEHGLIGGRLVGHRARYRLGAAPLGHPVADDRHQTRPRERRNLRSRGPDADRREQHEAVGSGAVDDEREQQEHRPVRQGEHQQHGPLSEPVGRGSQQRPEAGGAEADGCGGEPAQRQGAASGDDHRQHADHHHGERQSRDEGDEEVGKAGETEKARLGELLRCCCACHGSRASKTRCRVPPLSVGMPTAGRYTVVRPRASRDLAMIAGAPGHRQGDAGSVLSARARHARRIRLVRLRTLRFICPSPASLSSSGRCNT